MYHEGMLPPSFRFTFCLLFLLLPKQRHWSFFIKWIVIVINYFFQFYVMIFWNLNTLSIWNFTSFHGEITEPSHWFCRVFLCHFQFALEFVNGKISHIYIRAVCDDFLFFWMIYSGWKINLSVIRYILHIFLIW